MEISNKTFYGNQLLLTIPNFTFAVIYNHCIFRGIDFSEIHAMSNVFTYCRFEECIFTESVLYVFNGCTFINCEFSGTFKVSSFIDCNFDTHVPYMPMVCPVEDEFIGWKVCRKSSTDHTPYLVKLCIPEDAERTSGFGSRKCRCNRACVLNILNIDGSQPRVGKVVSYWDGTFSYSKGQWVYVNDYDSDRRYVCSRGINFFMERQEAINYYESELV